MYYQGQLADLHKEEASKVIILILSSDIIASKSAFLCFK